MTFWNPDTIRSAMGGVWVHRPPLVDLPKDRPADLPPPPADALYAPITGVSTDTRTIRPGQVFIALRGENHDGHGYLEAAVAGGAPIVVVDDAGRVPEGGYRSLGGSAVGVMKVGDCGKALLKLAGAYRKSLKQTKVIAVCGSNGKTTTTRLIDAALRPTLRGTASVKSFNNAVGVPLTILSAKENDQYLVCEVGTNAPGEIVQLAEVVQPDIAVITSIGREHLELLGDLAGVAKEEASIITYVRPKGLVVATADSPELADHLKRAGNVVTFGRAAGAALRLTSAEQDEDGVRFTINGRVKGRVGLLGEHNALNAIAALAVARRLNVEEGAALAALATAAGPGMRLERTRVGGITVLNDAYNANPDSMIAGVRTLVAMKKPCGARRCVAVLGEMLEMGGAGDEGHRAVAREIAAGKGVDVVVLVGAGMAAARDELLALGFPRERVVYLADLADGRDARAAEVLREGDVVLVKGSRRVRLERVVAALGAGRGEPGAPSATVTTNMMGGAGSGAAAAPGRTLA